MVAVAAAIVITIVILAIRIAKRAPTAEGASRCCASRPPSWGIGRINDSGRRILHSARALRKVAVGK